MRCLTIAAALGLLAAPAAAQDDVVYSISATELRDILQERGATVTLDKSDTGALMLYGTNVDNINFDIFFYDCDEAKVPQCLRLQYRASFTTTKPTTLDLVNGFNRERAYGRGYLATDGAAVVEHLVSLEGGVTREGLGASFDFFDLIIDDFTSYIGW